MAHKFNVDKYQLDQKLRDRIRAVIRGLTMVSSNHSDRYRLDSLLAKLQPVTGGTNIGRIGIGVLHHWDDSTHSRISEKIECTLTLLRQLIINFWDYLLEGADESLKPDGQIENHLETLEDYVEFGLDNYVVVGDERRGFWLMWKEGYRKAMEGVR